LSYIYFDVYNKIIFRSVTKFLDISAKSFRVLTLEVPSGHY